MAVMPTQLDHKSSGARVPKAGRVPFLRTGHYHIRLFFIRTGVFPAFLAAWFFAGLGAVVGSILGHGAGKPGLFGGAVLGAVLVREVSRDTDLSSR